VDGAVESAPRIRWLFYPGDTNMPRAGDTYGLGDEINVSVEWDRAVEYTGTPRLALTIGARTRHATPNYRSGGNAKITFRYVVQADDMDGDGVSIAANALSLDGGSITLQERPAVAASLTHDALEDAPERKVDGSLAPSVASVDFGGPASGDTYTLGETIEVVVTFDSEVAPDFRPRLAIEVGSETRLAFLSSRSGTSFTFGHVVLPSDRDADGISLPANALRLNGASVNANLDHEAVPADPGRKVDGGIAVAPRVTDVSVGRPSRNDTFGLGEEIRVWVSFDKPVRVTGFNRGPGAGPELQLEIGDHVRKATIQALPATRAYQGKTVSFVYVVRGDDRAAGGIGNPADSLALNGGTITILGDLATNADLRHSGTASAHEVDGGAVSAPTMPSWAPYNVSGFGVGTLGRGAAVLAYVPFDRQVRVTGRPELLVEIGDGQRRLAYVPEWSSPTGLYFGYLVQAGDFDADGLSVPENPVVGGAITLVGDDSVHADLRRGANSDFSWDEQAVDGRAVVTPTVDMEGVNLFWAPQSRGVHGLGDTVRARFCFDLPVKASGAIDAALTIGARTRRAWLSRDQVRNPALGECLTFAYTIGADDLDADGISIPANSLRLNGGSIVLAGDPSIAAELRHEAVGDDRIHRVDGGIRDAARVTSVSFANGPADGSAYRAGETIEIRVGFSKALALSGRPAIVLGLGGGTKRAAYERLVSAADTTTAFASDSSALHFAYTVRSGDVDTDGIAIPANSLSLNGGSLTLPGDASVPVDLSHAAVNPREGRSVDAPGAPEGAAPAFSTGIAGQVWVVNETVSLDLPEATGGDGVLAYSLTPDLPPGLLFDEDRRLISGTPLAAAEPMAFEYTATDGGAGSSGSATLAFSIGVLARPAAEVGAWSVGDDAVEVAWRGRWSDPGRGRLLIEARSPVMDWTSVGTVNPSSGEFIVRGLAPETPHTFRLRFEATGAAARAVSFPTAPEYSEEFSVTTGLYTGPCRTGPGYLCLRDGRFELRADWTNPDRAADFGAGTSAPVDVSDESGLFWFFDPANVELVAKVLDGSRLNGYYWMFFGALSDVEYWLTLRDTAVGGARRTYHNPPKEICGQSDLRALPGDVAAALGQSSSSEAAPGLGQPEEARLAASALPSVWLSQSSESAGVCESSGGRLCLLDDRFSVEVSFIDPNVADPAADSERAAIVLPSLTTDNTGFFWFFNRENVELAVKVLDGRAINGNFWLLYGSLSDVEYEITVTDTVTGESKTYRNEAGSTCGEIDTGPSR